MSASEMAVTCSDLLGGTRPVAALYCREDSNYLALPGVDVWDKLRDARRWPGGSPLVAHPPCRAWGRLRLFAHPEPGERELALRAVKQVQRCGGVLEHPRGSLLWSEAGLPAPGQRDDYGGWTLPIHQHWWGHRAEKATLLYVVGCEPADIPQMPMLLGEPTHVVQSRKRHDCRPHITKAEREHTPPNLAEWLVELARRCVVTPNTEAELPPPPKTSPGSERGRRSTPAPG